jgi:hypothetical protein
MNQQQQLQATSISRSVMAKKFKINDGSTKYVETATLLEPANNSASNQNEQEEIKEVSFQLAQIKKKHDEAKKLGNQKQDELDKLRKEIEQLGVQEHNAEGPINEVHQRITLLNEALSETRYKTEEEMFTKQSYLYMLDRMKKDFIASKIASGEHEVSLKSKSGILDTEQHRQRKIKEEKLQSKQIFTSLMDNIQKQQNDRQQRIHELQKCIRNKEESVQKRIERQRKNQEIAEAAANENKDSSELRMREKLYIQKLWNAFMKKKMEKEMYNTKKIDEAFKEIKTQTKITDVSEMVKKFLTRESTYSQLLTQVSEFERTMENLKKDHIVLEERLSELKHDTNPTEGDDKAALERFQDDEEIKELRAKIELSRKDQAFYQEKYKKINIVNDQICGWARKVN